MAGRGVPVRRIPILVEDLIKNGYAFLEGRQSATDTDDHMRPRRLTFHVSL